MINNKAQEMDIAQHVAHWASILKSEGCDLSVHLSDTCQDQWICSHGTDDCAEALPAIAMECKRYMQAGALQQTDKLTNWKGTDNMNKYTVQMINRLQSLGITLDDALALRRISMTLHRWHELECGTDHGHIEQDESTGKWYSVSWNSWTGKESRYRIADREKGALKRLDNVMSQYLDLAAYVQGDPRGCSLYIYCRNSPTLAMAKYGIESVYSSIGVAVYK